MKQNNALENLVNNPQLFNLFQATSIIESATCDSCTQEVAERINIHFRSDLSQAFPISEIAAIQVKKIANKPDQYDLYIPCLGLCGAHGLLPRHYSELLIERLRLKDTALRDFLDRITHRMVVLCYRGWQKNRFHSLYTHSKLSVGQRNLFTDLLYSLMGHYTAGLHNKLPISDDNLLYYAGILSSKRRSVYDLQTLLSDYFSIPVGIQSFQNRCIPIPLEKRSRVGLTQVGINTLLGSQVIDNQTHVLFLLGPLTTTQYMHFYPQEYCFKSFTQLIFRYLGMVYTIEIQLLLKPEETPDPILGGKRTQLGRTLWLMQKPLTAPVSGAMFKVT